MSIQVGDTLGDYQVTGVLGRGGMGKVFRVRNVLTHREEAMKVVLSNLDEEPEAADRFLREMQVHASLEHPNIAALRTALRIEGRLVMILELVEGVSLEARLREGRMEILPATGCIMQMLSALAYAHERGVVHRDIKPSNILVASGGVVKLTDFGIARSNAAERLTRTGHAVGTLAYMSPEQIRCDEADARSDIYSLGLTFYEMVTGRRAIDGNSEHALVEAQLNLMPTEPREVSAAIPVQLSGVIMRAIAKQPARRFQSAAEFAAALKRPPETERAPGPDATPPPELAELETSLSRVIGPIAKRLVADAARRYASASEIRAALAAQIEDRSEREKFLKTSYGTGVIAPQRTPAPQPIFDPAALDRLAQALAVYVGPIAKVLVSRAARQQHDIKELQDALAAEIPSAEDRRRFLSGVRSIL